MYLQEILEVAIGLVFMWLVLSIAAMSLQEWISNMLQWRAKGLESAIRQMLTSPDLAKQFYNHPLVSNLYSQAKNPNKKSRLPSYIPANKFALALFDILMKAGAEATPLQALTSQIEAQLTELDNPELQKLAQEDWKGVLDTAKQLLSSPSGEAGVDSLKARIQAYAAKYPEVQPVIDQNAPQMEAYFQQFTEEQRAAAAPGAEQQPTLRQVHLGVSALGTTSQKLKDTLTAVLRSAETFAQQGEQTVASARLSVETWFNDAMDRLSGSYKRQAQLAAFVIGFVLALILNVDSIHVATSLWREPTLRQAIIAEAQSYAQQNTQVPGSSTAAVSNPYQTIPQLQQQLQALTIPFGWTTAPVDTSGKACYLVPFVTNTVWGLPGTSAAGKPTCIQIDNFPVDIGAWLTKLLGFAITAAATAQGAPFWFDILKKIVNVRSAGINPDEKAPVG